MSEKTTEKNEEMVRAIDNAVEYVIPASLTRKIKYDSFCTYSDGKLKELVMKSRKRDAIPSDLFMRYMYGVILDFSVEGECLYPIIYKTEERIENFKQYFEVINPNNSEKINVNWIRPAIVSSEHNEVKLIQKGVICLK